MGIAMEGQRTFESSGLIVDADHDDRRVMRNRRELNRSSVHIDVSIRG